VIRHRPFQAAFAALALVCASAPAPASDAGLWRTWDAGLAEAERTGRPVVVDVYTDWCGWCKRMDREVYSREDVRSYLREHFVPIKLNAESSDKARYKGKDVTQRTVAAGFRVSGYPTTVFLRSDGAHVINVPGYVPADQFVLILRYIGEGHMDRGVDFKDFRREQSARKPAP
jgi:thioredoxin-related protein